MTGSTYFRDLFIEGVLLKTGLVELPALKSKISAVLREEGLLGVGSPPTINTFPLSVTVLLRGSKNEPPYCLYEEVWVTMLQMPELGSNNLTVTCGPQVTTSPLGIICIL